jgi:hypothetical protein
MKTTALKPYEGLTQKIKEILERSLARSSKSTAMLPCLGELDIYRETSDSLKEIQALLERMPGTR